MVKKLLLLVAFLCMLLATGHSQEAKFKALFMYNFTKYLEWPADKQHGDFIIGVYGNSPILQELEVIAGKKKVGVQSIVVKEINSPSEIKSCHILYLPENRSSKIDEITSNAQNSGTVLITDKPGMAKTTSGLNYVQVNGKQSFEINKANIEKQGVKVNSVLLSLGIVVE